MSPALSAAEPGIIIAMCQIPATSQSTDVCWVEIETDQLMAQLSAALSAVTGTPRNAKRKIKSNEGFSSRRLGQRRPICSVDSVSRLESVGL